MLSGRWETRKGTQQSQNAFLKQTRPLPRILLIFWGGPSFFFSLSLPPLFSGYFSQFGAIARLRVSRNKKTAKARSYAFLEFGSPDVAAIAAEAMDG